MSDVVEELFILRELVIAGQFQWIVFLSLEEAQAGAEAIKSGLKWGQFNHEKTFGTQVMFDSNQDYAILRIQTGKFYTDYTG